MQRILPRKKKGTGGHHQISKVSNVEVEHRALVPNQKNKIASSCHMLIGIGRKIGSCINGHFNKSNKTVVNYLQDTKGGWRYCVAQRCAFPCKIKKGLFWNNISDRKKLGWRLNTWSGDGINHTVYSKAPHVVRLEHCPLRRPRQICNNLPPTETVTENWVKLLVALFL